MLSIEQIMSTCIAVKLFTVLMLMCTFVITDALADPCHLDAAAPRRLILSEPGPVYGYLNAHYSGRGLSTKKCARMYCRVNCTRTWPVQRTSRANNGN